MGPLTNTFKGAIIFFGRGVPNILEVINFWKNREYKRGRLLLLLLLLSLLHIRLHNTFKGTIIFFGRGFPNILEVINFWKNRGYKRGRLLLLLLLLFICLFLYFFNFFCVKRSLSDSWTIRNNNGEKSARKSSKMHEKTKSWVPRPPWSLKC